MAACGAIVMEQKLSKNKIKRAVRAKKEIAKVRWKVHRTQRSLLILYVGLTGRFEVKVRSKHLRELLPVQ